MTGQASRRLILALCCAAALALAAVSPAGASDSLRIRLKVDYQLAEPPVFDPVESTLELHFAGTGHAKSLGAVTVDTKVRQQVTDGCDPAVALHVVAAPGGTLTIEGNDRVCPGHGQPDRFIYGVWDVVSGTGAYLGATGSGVLTAKINEGSSVQATFEGVLIP